MIPNSLAVPGSHHGELPDRKTKRLFCAVAVIGD